MVCLLWTCSLLRARADGLEAQSEFQRSDPFGKVLEVDQGKQKDPAQALTRPKVFVLEAARNGYVSLYLQSNLSQAGPYSLSVRFDGNASQVQADLFKVWYHLTQKAQKYIPDALIPVANPYSGRMPDVENGINGQGSQAFWVDLWIPKEMQPGEYLGQAVLKSAGKQHRVRLTLRVLKTTIPDEDALVIDHNSYGTGWVKDLYPKLCTAAGSDFYRSEALFKLIHSYHRIVYEHRGTFHQLGYGHGGKVAPEFAPELKGQGRGREIASWELFDRHYAALLDGSAFRETRRGPKPIPFVYLPINPEWPASFLAWGEPGYEAEFVNIVGAMEKHFREKGWTQTRFEMFFNHKKRYKAFPWDGDEARFAKDDAPVFEYGRLLKKAVPNGSPVKFVFRNDSSWRMEDQFRTLAGVVNFWVCSRDVLGWMPEQLKVVKGRGDIVWIYSEAPPIEDTSSSILENPLRAWLWNLDGYIHWLTVSPSQDPWFQSAGERTCLVYPGEKFGVEGPIPSIRLKIQRNFAQDLALLKQLETTRGSEAIRAEVTQRVNGTQPKDWWSPRPPMADLPPEDWTNGGIEPNLQAFQNWGSQYWEPVRKFILSVAEGGKTP